MELKDALDILEKDVGCKECLASVCDKRNCGGCCFDRSLTDILMAEKAILDFFRSKNSLGENQSFVD